VPFGTHAPKGVEMTNLGNIGFYADFVHNNGFRRRLGVTSGSVTNWTFDTQTWEEWLHCTSNINRRYDDNTIGMV
jgi:hypothetical protein